MKITYIICRAIINISFIIMSVFLTIHFNNGNYLWFLVVPILSHCCGFSFKDDKDKENNEN